MSMYEYYRPPEQKPARGALVTGVIILSVIAGLIGIMLGLLAIEHGLIVRGSEQVILAAEDQGCTGVNWLDYNPCDGIIPVRSPEAGAIQHPAGYRLLTPLAAGEYYVFNTEYTGAPLKAESQ